MRLFQVFRDGAKVGEGVEFQSGAERHFAWKPTGFLPKTYSGELFEQWMARDGLEIRFFLTVGTPAEGVAEAAQKLPSEQADEILGKLSRDEGEALGVLRGARRSLAPPKGE